MIRKLVCRNNLYVLQNFCTPANHGIGFPRLFVILMEVRGVVLKNDLHIKKNTRNLVVVGLMLALSVLLAFTPLGMIPLPMISVTISHIPTIISAILEGPVVGMLVGAAFGMASLIRALTSPVGVLDPFFINPLVSVLPRVLIGLTSYYAYAVFFRIFAKQSFVDNISIALAAAIGSLTNTLGCLGMLAVIYAGPVLEKTGVTAQAILISTTVTFGMAEMAAATAVSFAVIKAVKRVRRQ